MATYDIDALKADSADKISQLEVKLERAEEEDNQLRLKLEQSVPKIQAEGEKEKAQKIFYLIQWTWKS